MMGKALLRRRSLLALGSLCGASWILPPRVYAQVGPPGKALRILVGFSAGGGTEPMARAIAPRLELRTSRRVAVENKANDKKEPAGEFMSKALTEGSVIAFLPTTTIAMTPPREIFPFDSRSDLVPLTMVGVFQVALIVPRAANLATFADYIAWLKAGPPERRRLGTSSADPYLKLYGLMIARECGVDLEIVPHKTSSRLVADLKAGSLPAGIGSVSTLLDHNRDGAMKILMTSGAKRATVLRDVPTAVELHFPNLELQEWYGFFASSASPPAVAAEWSRLLQPILLEPEVVAQLATLGLDAAPTTQEEATTLFKARLKIWAEKTAAFGMKMPE
jgi:tripartite-type tricarboxylate transporter receptor subunit TctC